MATSTEMNLGFLIISTSLINASNNHNHKYQNKCSGGKNTRYGIETIINIFQTTLLRSSALHPWHTPISWYVWKPIAIQKAQDAFLWTFLCLLSSAVVHLQGNFILVFYSRFFFLWKLQPAQGDVNYVSRNRDNNCRIGWSFQAWMSDAIHLQNNSTQNLLC